MDGMGLGKCAVRIFLSALLLPTVKTTAQISYNTIALSGQPAPGTPAGITFNDFIWPVINNAGKVAFTSVLAGNGLDSTNDTGIWSNSTGSLGLVARARMTAPGSSGFFEPLFGSNIVLDSNGAVTFISSLSGPGINSTNGSGLWSGPANALAVVALAGMHAPGTAGIANFASFLSSGDAMGRLVFEANLSGADTVGSNSGIWAGTTNALQVAARVGDPAPSTEAGTTFTQFNNYVVNPSGQVAFVANLQTNQTGIWRGLAGALSLVARANDLAPGTSGAMFSTFGVVSMNAAGHVLFDAQLTGSGVTTADQSGLWAGTPSALTLVARAGSSAPGMPPGTVFTSFFNAYITENNQIVFYANDSTNAAGIWAGTPGAISLVAHENNPASGAPGENFSFLNPPEINRAGEIAFFAQVDPAPPAGRRGIWATDPEGVLRLIALEGNSIDLGSGDVRQISFLSFQDGGGNQDGLASSMNDSGGVAFHADFTDASRGVFTAALPIGVLRILSVQKFNNDIQLKFVTAANHTYRVEYKNNLSDSNWLMFGASTYNGTGGYLIVTDPGAGSLTRRFYHVVEL